VNSRAPSTALIERVVMDDEGVKKLDRYFRMG